MKTAEHWIRYTGDFSTSGDDFSDNVHVSDIRKIQLDAMKEGMKRAAELVDKQNSTCVVYSNTRGAIAQCEQVILSAAEQLTEKDL